MITQKSIWLRPFSRGFHLVTDILVTELPELSDINHGIAHFFLKHTSASLTINENADPTVRKDMENFFSDLADDKHYYVHTYEGSDDMPAHIKSSLLGCSVQMPITHGRLNLGTWQGIYLGEHRDHAASREVIVTLMGE